MKKAMTPFPESSPSPFLLMVAGAKGAIASTLGVAITALDKNPKGILPSLTTADKFPYLGPAQAVRMVGWDKSRKSLLESIEDLSACRVRIVH
ncbi:MAG: hypothetical protein HY879_12780 [Deltaproteobacteria bacterium]|nr:hypothetical protein [Deltaproteobacteria bacterium]